MDALHLIVGIAGERVAIPAARVDSVLEVESTTPVPHAAAHVVGLAALRSRVITLVDCRVALGFAPLAAAPALRQAVVVAIDGHCYGLVVDTVDDVIEARAAPATLAATLAPAWTRAATGLVIAGDTLLPCLDPALLLLAPAAA